MDLAVRNGTVYTDDGLRNIDVGIRDGTIVSLGAVSTASREVDADGGLVLPGLVNTHTHAAMTLLRGYADDLPLHTWLEERIWPVEAELEPTDIEAGTRLAALEMITSGTTTLADMYFGMESVADVVAESGLRARLGYGMITAGKDEAAARDELETGVRFVRDVDGRAGGRIHGMIAPHAPYTCDEWFLEAAAERAMELSVPLHIHLNETSSEVEEYLAETGNRPTVHLDELGCWDGPAFVAHGVHLDEQERSLLGERGVGVAHCPSANMKLAAGVAPVTELEETGVRVGLGTDGPASNNTLDMFSEMRHAALLAKVSTGDPTVSAAADVVDMATRRGAELLGLQTGVLATGRPADLIVVDLDAPHLTPAHDPISHAVYAARGSDVETTIVDGEVLMEDRDVLVLDERAVRQEAATRARELVARVDG